MNRITKRLLIVTALLALCGVLSSAALAERSGEWGDNLTWVLEDDGTLTITGEGDMDDFLYSTNSAWRAFARWIERVVISDGVTCIGHSAFKNCVNLKRVDIPNGVTRIGAYAFIDCENLTEIVLPDSVTTLQLEAFKGCGSLTDMAIPGGVAEIPNSLFYNCRSLANLALPDGITAIGDYAFCQCGQLTHLALPQRLASLGRSVFYRCDRMESLTIPDGVTSVHANAFEYCTAPRYARRGTDGARALGRAGYDFRDAELQCTFKYLDDDHLELVGAPNTARFDIPDGVTSIGDYAFRNRTLTGVTIPSSVTRIGRYAFENCANLTDLVLPATVTVIDQYAFTHCVSIEAITISDSITVFGACAFEGCTGLRRVTIEDGVTSIGGSAFMGCTSLRHVRIPGSISRIFRSAFALCRSLKSVEIGEGVTIIEADVFSGCTGLTQITLPNSVTHIGEGAFSGCRGLMSISIPDSVTNIGNGAFSNCTSLTRVTLPRDLSRTGDRTFGGCSSLRDVCFLGDFGLMGNDLFDQIERPTIYCYRFSHADAVFSEEGYRVIYLDRLNPDDIRTVALPGDFLLECGKTRTLTAALFPDYDRPTVVWRSSAPGIVSVEDGVLNAIAPGTATITARAGGASASVNVTAYVEADDFALSPAEAWTLAGETLQLRAVDIRPAGANLSLTWRSSERYWGEVVDTDGLVSRTSPGDVTIMATSARGITRTCLLHVCNPVTAIAFEPNVVTVRQFGQTPLTANVTMSDQHCVNHLVTFASSDERIATVDADGVVTGRSAGAAIITAVAANGITAACEVTVTALNTLDLPADLTSIEGAAFAGIASADAVRIPAGVTGIADDAFSGVNLIIIAPQGSYAARWAAAHGFTTIEE